MVNQSEMNDPGGKQLSTSSELPIIAWLTALWCDNKPSEARAEAYRSLNATARLRDHVTVIDRGGASHHFGAGTEVTVYGDPSSKKGVTTAATVRTSGRVLNVLTSGAVKDVTPPRSPNAPPPREYDSTSWFVVATK